MADKKIKLYKVKEDGTLDKDTQLLPETSMEAVSGLETALSGKQASLTETQLNAVNSGITSDKVSQYDGYDNSKVSKTDLVKDLTYDIIEKEIPGEIVDGETYELPMEYDMSKFDLPSESEPPLVLYGDLEHIPFILIYFQGIGYNDDENGYSYMDIGDGYHWYIMGEEPVLYEGEPLSITIDESKINEEEKDILSIVLGIQPTIVTVNQTVEDKINEELKDKTYDYIESNIPVDGHSYKLKENANINSLLSDEGSSVTLILYRNESYRIEYIKSSSKGGSTEYNLNVYDSNDEIIDIYMIALGAGGQHYVNQWQNGTDVLTLDFLYNEQTVNPSYKDYFNQFLNVQESSSRSLKQKFDEVENEPLKDKLYEKGEKYYQPLFTPSDETLNLIWDAGGNPNSPHLVYEDNNLIIETYINSFSMQVFQYYRFTIGNDIYQGSNDYSGYWQHTDDDWTNVDYINTQEDLPKITFDKQYITSGDEELFNGLIYSKDVNITLEQKFNEVESPLKDKTYEEVKSELVNGEDYTLPISYSDDFFTTYEDLFTTGSGTSIYSTGLGVDIALCKMDVGIDFNFILFNDADHNECVGYLKVPEGVPDITDGWYSAEWDENTDGWVISNLPVPTTASNPTLLQYEDTFVIQNYEEVLKAVLGLGIMKISLEQKFDEVEPPYTITDYTEDNGALTSITVKSKETGESTILTVGGGGKQLYQHNMRISVNNGTNNHTTLILSFYTKIRAIAYENTSDGRLAFIQSMIDGDVYQLMPTSAPMYDSSNAILGYITRAWLDSGSLKLTYTKSDKTTGLQSFGYNTITDNVDEVIEL